MEKLFCLHSFPRAIIHIDGDSFFASCEQAVNPRYRGRPVITGKERGIISSASLEAKKMGIKRGISLRDARRICPELIMLPSDYETYSLFSRRMFDIIRKFTPEVEEYSIDEAFADLTGLRRKFRTSYEDIGLRIKESIEKNLGITCSLGIAPTKVLAKIASRWNKPSGFTVISGPKIHLFLRQLPVKNVWGIGPNTAAFLAKHDIVTALEFANLPEVFVKKELNRNHHEIWTELRGRSVYPVQRNIRFKHTSISKTKTFTPPRRDREFVFSQLAKNLENAFIKARRHGLACSRISIVIVSQQYEHRGIEIKLNHSTSYPLEIIGTVRKAFGEIFEAGKYYRATTVILQDLAEAEGEQLLLFQDPVRAEKIREIYRAMDCLSRRYGKHNLHLASSLLAQQTGSHTGARADIPERRKDLLKGETGRKRLDIIRLR